MPEALIVGLDDYVTSLRWSPQGDYLAALPALGGILVLTADGEVCARLPCHLGGNGAAVWHPRDPILATYGQDGLVRIYQLPNPEPLHTWSTGPGWAERAEWNSDGTLLAVAVGKAVRILEGSTGAERQVISGHKSTVSDLAWNPCRPDELVTVCDGGAKIWRIGQLSPTGQFDWGGASLYVGWSPDGRWFATGDQTPSVHLYDTFAHYPLHIQGFDSKVKALAWRPAGTWLAVSGGAGVTLWPCMGKNGPEGANPVELTGHTRDVLALDFLPGGAYLASGAKDGKVLLWRPHSDTDSVVVAQRAHPVTALRWSPDGRALAFGTAAGELTIFRLKQNLPPSR